MYRINDVIASSVKLGPSLIEGGGVGLFATAVIPDGIPVCEYKGEIFTTAEIIARKEKGIPLTYSVNFATKVCPQGSPLCCDSHPEHCKSEIGLGGFINDKMGPDLREAQDCGELSREAVVGGSHEQHIKQFYSLRQNLLKRGYNVYFWEIPQGTSFLVMSLRQIEVGEELYTDYGNEYWTGQAS
jgi:hypothetical protein